MSANPNPSALAGDTILALLETSTDGFCALDQQGRFLYVNRQAEHILDQPADALVGRTVDEADAEGLVARECRRALEGRSTVEFRLHRRPLDAPLDTWFDVRVCPAEQGLAVSFHEVTGQVRAERELRAGEQRFREIFDQAGVGICECGPDGRVTAVNQCMCDMLGRSSAELLGRIGTEFTHPDDVETSRRKIEAVVRGALPGFTIEKRYVRADGSVMWAETSVSTARDDAGRLVRMIAVVQDITVHKLLETERQRNQATARAGEERLRQALDAGRCGIYEWDIAANRVTWSDRLYEFFGLSPSEFGGTVEAFAARVHPDDRAAVWASVRACIDGDVPHRMEYRAIRPDGAVRWIYTNSSVLRDEAGAPLRLLGACIDVTDRHAADEALRRSEDKYRTLTDAVGSLMWMSDAAGDVRFYNRRWDEFMAGDAHRMLGGGWKDLVHPDDIGAVVRERTVALAEQRAYSVELRLRRHDGQYRWHLARIVPHLDAGGRVLNWFGTATDVHDMKTAEAAVLQAKAEAEHANRAKDQFLAVLSHELRTPLTPVVMTVAAMEMDRTISPQMREDLAMIRRNIELETKLIDDLLDVTRISNGKLRLQPRAGDAHVLVKNVLEILKSDVHEKRLELAVEFDAADPSVFADPARLQQVFWNLIKNAIKFTPCGGRITVRSSNPSERVIRVEVIDSGAGIEPGVLPRIFNAFDQGEQTITRQFGGLGLGLAISKALTEMHGGAIHAESAGKGQGARFVVDLPTRSPVERMVDQIQPMGKDGGTRPKVRVLLVEDHLDTQRTLARLLDDRGYAVVTAGSVTAALATLAQQAVDVLVSDIGLPDATGYELMRRARPMHPSLRAVAVSGFGMDADLKASLDAGFAAHLTKPVDIQQLDALIRSLAAAPAATSVPVG